MADFNLLICSVWQKLATLHVCHAKVVLILMVFCKTVTCCVDKRDKDHRVKRTQLFIHTDCQLLGRGVARGE